MEDILYVDYILRQPQSKYFVKVDMDYLTKNGEHVRKSYNFLNFEESYAALFKKQSEAINLNPDILLQSYIVYGLIHAKFLMTEAGQTKMIEKFKKQEFPSCPRVLCNHFTCFPYGSSAILGEQPMKLFCPNCTDIYLRTNNESLNIDGAFFGPFWIHTLMRRHPEIVNSQPPETYVPRIYGFRIYNPNVRSVSSNSVSTPDSSTTKVNH